MEDHEDPKFIAFANKVVAQLWRFPSSRQYDILSRLPKAIQKAARKKVKNIIFKTSRIEHDELMHVSKLYGMSMSQYILMLHRSFKDTVVEKQIKAPSITGDSLGYISVAEDEVPQSAEGAHQHVKNLGLPHQGNEAEYSNGLESIFGKLKKAGLV